MLPANHSPIALTQITIIHIYDKEDQGKVVRFTLQPCFRLTKKMIVPAVAGWDNPALL